MRPRLNGAKSWELSIAHTLHLSRTRGPEILYTLPRVARGGGMPLVAVALLTLQGGGSITVNIGAAAVLLTLHDI